MFSLKKKDIKLLLVDDSKIIRTFLNRLAKNIAKKERISFSIDTFASYPEFLEKRKDSYDVAVIDWNLDKNSSGQGSKVIEVIRNNTRFITIYTGMTDDTISIGKYAQDKNISYIPKGEQGVKVTAFILNALSHMSWSLKN